MLALPVGVQCACFSHNCAEHSETLGPLQFHITEERDWVFFGNNYTFLLRGEFSSLFDEKSLLDVF